MDETTMDILGHAAYVLIALGMLLLGRKNRWGWVCRFLGEGGWIWLGWLMGMSSIWFWGILFMSFDAYGFWQWSAAEKKLSSPPNT